MTVRWPGGPAPHHDPYPKTDAENIASICPSLQIKAINISRLPCSNRDRRFLIIFSATPRFSAAGFATFLYDLEFFIWNWRSASMASELGSADPRLDMLAERGVTWPGLPVLLPLPAPSPPPSSLLEQNIFVHNKYFSSDSPDGGSPRQLARGKGGLPPSETRGTRLLGALAPITILKKYLAVY